MIKRFLFNSENKISLTKLGGTIVSIAGIVLTFPEAAAQAGIVIVLPGAVKMIAWLICFVGGKLLVDGARDAIDKK